MSIWFAGVLVFNVCIWFYWLLSAFVCCIGLRMQCFDVFALGLVCFMNVLVAFVLVVRLTFVVLYGPVGLIVYLLGFV